MSRLTDGCRRSLSSKMGVRKLCTGSTIILALCVLSGVATAVLMLIVHLAEVA